MTRGKAPSKAGAWPYTSPVICWSYTRGQWWRVAGGSDLEAVRVVARRRQAFARALGLDEARFVATEGREDPAMVWESQQK